MDIITARPHRLLPAVTERIGALHSAGERCMVLVPSQATLQTELEIMRRLKLDGSFTIDVLSPARLQGRVFERAGMPSRTIFDERGKSMVMLEILSQEKERLTVYRGAAENGAPGFVSRVCQLIADFKRSGKSPQALQAALDAMDEVQRRTPAARKLADTVTIYAAYEERMAGTLCDAEDVAQEMLARLPRSGVLDGQHVLVLGFDMITPAFAGQLIAMAPLAASLTLAVETDRNGAPDGRLFAPVNQSLDRLRAMAQERGIPVRTQEVDAPLDAPWDICALESSLYALGGRAQDVQPEHIAARAVSTPRQEAHLAGARIRQLLMAGEDPARLAIVYPRGSGYAALLSAVLPQYGVTAYIAEKRPAQAHPLCRFVLASLSVISGGWRAADIVECVQSGFMGLTRAEMDALCAYCEGTQLRTFTKPFTYLPGGDEQTLAALNQSRERVAAPLLALGQALRAAHTADDTVAAVLALLTQVNALDTLEDMRRELEQAGLAPEAEDCAQVWNALMDTLDQLHALLGGHSASAGLALSLLESGLSALSLSALPPADGSVICGEIGNVRTGRVGTLLALGMNDVPPGADGGLLTAQEQEEAVRATGAYLGMRPSERAALAQLDELKALSGAGEQLLISYALADETGRALREGAAVQALRRLFPQMTVSGGLIAQERMDMLTAPDAALEALSTQLSEAADGALLDDASAQAYAALARSEQGREKLTAVTRQLGEQGARRLDGAQARALYGRPVMSVSRLETFAQCPYRHFVRYGLVPREPMEPGVNRAELGTLYHEAAERFTRAVTALPEFPQVAPEVCDALMGEAVAPLIAQWRQSPLGESARGAAIARRIGRTARRTARSIVSQFSGSRFRPMDSELVFGRDGVAPIMLELADGTFAYLQGRIDRVDILDEGEKRIRVIDYKSGAKRFDPTMAYYGLQLQLLLYLAAALAQIPDAGAAGFFYCHIADPTIRSDARVKEEIERQLAKKLALAGVSLSDVEILRAQGTQQAAMITRDGRPSAAHRASMTDEAGMNAMVGFARRKAAQLAGEAYAGQIDDTPAALGAFCACQACRYGAICGFDPTIRPRRQLQKKGVEDLK
ncbi:MAG: PD-(D/E)XK nuclease family protein [Candidatus Ventricola sp.]